MTSKIKNITDRLVDGFRDYYLDENSFDARYVCGQLFLHGEAKAYDVGMPTVFNGDEVTRVEYMLNWYTHLWNKYRKEFALVARKVKKYDPFADSTMLDIAKLKRVVTVKEYVAVLSKLVETVNFLELMSLQYRENHDRIKEILTAPVYVTSGLTYLNRAELLPNLVESTKAALERLSRDYTGEDLYPSATLTLFSVTDQLHNNVRVLSLDNAVGSLWTAHHSWFNSDVKALTQQQFATCSFKQLLEQNVPEVLVLTLVNLQLVAKAATLLENANVLALSTVHQLISETP